MSQQIYKFLMIVMICLGSNIEASPVSNIFLQDNLHSLIQKCFQKHNSKGKSKKSGLVGPQGPQGPPGQQGLQGIPGTPSFISTAYAHFYMSTTNSSVTIAPGDSFPLTMIGIAQNIVLNPNTYEITVLESGFYAIDYRAQANNPGLNVSNNLGIQIVGQPAVLQDATYIAGSYPTATSFQVSGRVMVYLNSGDTFSLVNAVVFGGANFDIFNPGITPAASLKIFRFF
jgi:hypothetical protein